MSKTLFTQKKAPRRGLLVSMLLLLLVILLLYFGTDRLSATSAAEQQKTLEAALYEGALHNYSLYGFYPEDLDSLLNKYHIVYDATLFFVDYQPRGSNLPPEITIIPLKGGM